MTIKDTQDALAILGKSRPANRPPLDQLAVEIVTERFCGHVSASTLRDATQADLDRADRLHLKGKCPHNVIYDVAGWMYDFRFCATCGRSLGMI